MAGGWAQERARLSMRALCADTGRGGWAGRGGAVRGGGTGPRHLPPCLQHPFTRTAPSPGRAHALCLPKFACMLPLPSPPLQFTRESKLNPKRIDESLKASANSSVASYQVRGPPGVGSRAGKPLPCHVSPRAAGSRCHMLFRSPCLLPLVCPRMCFCCLLLCPRSLLNKATLRCYAWTMTPLGGLLRPLHTSPACPPVVRTWLRCCARCLYPHAFLMHPPPPPHGSPFIRK